MRANCPNCMVAENWPSQQEVLGSGDAQSFWNYLPGWVYFIPYLPCSSHSSSFSVGEHTVSMSFLTPLYSLHFVSVLNILQSFLQASENVLTTLKVILVSGFLITRATWGLFWVGKIPWSSKWQSSPVLLPGKIPQSEEPSKLQSMGSQRVGYD